VFFTNLSANATNHLWDFGDGGFSAAVQPAHVYTNAGSYSVTLTSTGLGGSNSLTKLNYVLVTNLPPLITSQPQSLVVTQGAPAIFQVAASGSNLEFQWRRDGVDLAGEISSTLSLAAAHPTNAGIYSVLVSNSSGFTLSSNATLTLVTADDAIIVTGPPYSENFDVMGSSGTVPPHGWFVGTGSSSISGKTVTVGTGSSSSGGNYNFGSSGSSERALGSLASNSGSRDTEARFINASGGEIVELTIDYTGEQWRVGGTGSVNNTLQLQFSLDGQNFSVMGGAFDFDTPIDSGAASSLNGNSAANRVAGLGGVYAPAVPIPDGQTFYLRWADANDNSSDHGIAVDDLTLSFTISNAPPAAPVADFAADLTEGLAPLIVQFTNLSLNATDYQWSFGDGNTSTNLNPANTYTNAGMYSVTLLAIGAGGSNAVTFTNYILVTNIPPPAPVADFAADITEGLAPLTVQFTNLSLNATDYQWSFGDGNTSTNPNPANTYTNAGMFSVTLLAIGAGGSNAVTFTNYVTVTNIPPPAPVADFAADITEGLAPLIVQFTNLSLNATDYQWSFGDGNTSTNPNPANTYTNAGMYSVTLLAIGAEGSNSVTFTNYITVTNIPPPVPVADFVADVTEGFAPLMVNFTNLSLNASEYLWDFGEGSTSTNTNPTNTYSNAGMYSVTLLAIGAGGSNSVTFTNYITVTNIPPPVPVVDFVADVTEGLAPLAVQFTNLSLNATNYLWSFGDGGTSTNLNPATIYSNAGVYSVTLLAVGVGGSNSVTYTNYITATNSPVLPVLAIQPASILFSPVLTGAVAQASFVISNAGGALLSATANLTPNPFTLLDAGSNATPAYAFAVPAFTSTNVQLQFSSLLPGSFTNGVVFLSDGGDSTNSVVGSSFGPPVLFDLSGAGGEFVFSFETVAGVDYHVQFKDAIDDPVWQDLQTIPGDGSIKSVTNLTVSPAQRYYRVSVP